MEQSPSQTGSHSAG